jgi:serine/threonine protein kinase
VKPDNILVFDDPSGGVTIKMIDFAYSQRWTDENVLRRIPVTKPWNAPEWHSRGFKMRAAQALDIYSYGLVCLWMFCKCIDVELTGELERLLYATNSEWTVESIEEFKANPQHLETLDKDISESGILDRQILNGLRALFQSTLQRDKTKRPKSLGQCIDILQRLENDDCAIHDSNAQAVSLAPSDQIANMSLHQSFQLEKDVLPSHIDLNVSFRTSYFPGA